MKIRTAIHISLSLLTCSLFFASACTPNDKTKNSSFPKEGRTVKTLKTGWSFHRGDLPNAQKIKFDDSKWKKVSIPHCYNIKSGQSGGANHFLWDRAEYYKGPAWYRYNLKVDKLPADKSVFIRFDAACEVADLYVNGQKVGKHEGGFTAFCFDITKYLKLGKDNVIAVRVTNEYNDEIAPTSGDFVLFGGIYRPVRIITTSKTCIDPLDHASTGVFVTQKEISNELACLNVKTLVRNSKSTPETVTVTTQIIDADKKVVVSSTKNKTVKANSSDKVLCELSIKNPHLWHGLEDPYLYTLRTTISQGDKILDTLDDQIGLRWFRIDPKKGFFLNGKPYKIKGVNKHQDKLDKGWALTEKDLKEDMAIALEIGANGMRLAHYPHSEYFHKLCDKHGMLVLSEIPLVDVVKNTPKFHANIKLQLEELIKQNYNRPSIFTWGIFNEILMRPSDDPVQIILELHKLSKKLDPTRPTTCAGNLCAKRMQKAYEAIYKEIDIPGFNVYQGWYGGKPSHLKHVIKRYDKLSKFRGTAITEYGAGASIHHHADLPCRPRTTDRFHPEEWQAYVHEQNYNVIRKTPELWGSFLWNLIDFSSVWRSEGDHIGRNDKGLVTYDRKTRKDAFYFYKACWSKKPVLHLTSKRFKTRSKAKTIIKAYSNCKEVTAYLNGKSLGAKKSDDNIFIWKVSLKEGKNQVKVTGSKDGKELIDSTTWEMDPEYAHPDRWIMASKHSPWNHVPEFTLSPSKRGSWSHKSKDAWIRYTLDPKKPFSQLQISWAKNKIYNFAIQVSSDAKNWVTIYKGSSKGKDKKYETYSFPECNAKYLKIICTDKDKKSNGLAIYHVKLKSIKPKYPKVK